MLARRLVRIALSRMREGRLTVIEGGAATTFGPGGGPDASITVHDARVWSELARHGSVGLGHAYAAGWFDSPDLASLVRLAEANLRPITAVRDRVAAAIAPFRDRLPTSSRGREVDRANVSAHYDLSNEFFALMLDPTMAYSCAIFDDPDADLEEAQRAKLDRLCRLLDLDPDDHLLEIGTGWGGLAIHAASDYGCRVTTTTISAQQQAHAAARVAEAGLADRVRVLGSDYRDLEGRYDKVVSVEMIEAVDWRDHATFFSKIHDLVRPGGRVALQAIVIEDGSYERAKRSTDFIKALVFPGGCLPSVASIARSAEATGGLETMSVDRIGQHYPETLRRWQENIDRHHSEIAAIGFDQRRRRIWDLYLQYCIAAFESGHIDAVHIVLDKENRHGSLPHHDRLLARA